MNLRILLTYIWVAALGLTSIAAQAQTVRYIHTDALGSPVAVTNASRTVIEISEYEPYGQLVNRPVEAGPGYTGHVMDVSTGLAYMQQRYYDPMLGRFLSVDPVTASSSTGANFNRYWYANNNPYRFYDPDGRSACPGTSKTKCIQADTYKAAQSNGKTIQASPEVAKTMVDQKSSVAVTSGTKEKIAFVVKGEDGLTVQVAQDATTNSTSRTDSASAAKPKGALAVLHGHIDGRSDGVISPADAGPLRQGLPNGVVSTGRVGVSELVDGRLQFRMLEGRMSPHEFKELQKSLDKQQGQFLTP